jgi:hypothetical protein
MEKSLDRDITLSKLLRTSEQEEFFNQHTLICGIWDDLGIEGMVVCKDWDTSKGLENLNSRLFGYQLRARMNGHRNARSYLRWIHNKDLVKAEGLISEKDYVLAKEFLMECSYNIQ